MNTNCLPRIGAHLPIGKGLKSTADEARRLEIESVQVFLRNPRGMKARELGQDEVGYFTRSVKDLGLYPVVVHVPYICNPCAARDDLYELARRIVAEDLARCDAIQAQYLVLHPGAYTTSSPERATGRLIQLLNRVLEGYSGPTMILLETMAGQGSELGRSFEEVGRILDGVAQPSRVGVCLDTCHLYAAGYDLATTDGIEACVGDIDRSVGKERVRLVHANDSTYQLGTRRDRHAHIGQGFIGENGFILLTHHPFWSRLPFILETLPSGIARDVQTLKRLRVSPEVKKG